MIFEPFTVDRVRVTILSVPLDEPVKMAFSQLDTRQLCLVEVDADGITGYGESWINYPSWAATERVATLIEGVAPRVVGQTVSDPTEVYTGLVERLMPIARQWGAPGPMWQAISGIDLALWDLAGKAREIPISRLLDSTAEHLGEVAVYGSGVGPTDIEALCDRALEAGLVAVKAKVGFGAETDEKTLQLARESIGNSRQLFADANQAWTVSEALQFWEQFSRFDIGWLEEPISGDNLADLAEFSAKSDARLATGENVYTWKSFETYLSSGAISVLQPDPTKAGGITMASRVGRSARERGVEMAPHCYGGAIGLAASAQLSAINPSVTWLEFDVRPNPFRESLLDEPLPIVGGKLQIPTGPGLGITLNQETVTRFRKVMKECKKR